MLDAGSIPDTEKAHPRHPPAVFTGTCEVSLRRAVIPFRDPTESAHPGGRIQDLGLGLVLESADACRSRVLDLGSGELRHPDLSGPLVLLGWIFPRSFRDLVRRLDDSKGSEELARVTRPLALGLLAQAGFTPLTRPVHLRVGFQDICQDMDLHGETAIRLVLPEAGPIRCHMDYEESTLVIRTGRSRPAPDLEGALADAFPSRRILRTTRGEGRRTHDYHLMLPVSRSLLEMCRELRGLRRGFLHLMARFETERYQALKEATAAFGERDSLASLVGDPVRERRMQGEWVGPTTSPRTPRGIH
jgi:hypothetical protein